MSISTKTRSQSSISLIRESARDFALQYIKPYVMDWDESQHFPKEVLQKAGEYGFMGILVPFKIHLFPFFTAVDAILPESDPVLGSVKAQAPIILPDARSFMYFLCCSLEPNLSI